jgi:Carboxypeptidase regulatory-like domain
MGVLHSAILGSLVLAQLAPAQNGATVEGVVRNKVTGAGISGVAVSFWNGANRYQIDTNETGTFRITGVSPGDYNSALTKNGYSTDSGGLPWDQPKTHVSGGADIVRLRFDMIPPGVLRGRVVGLDGKPARAIVDLDYGITASTDANGYFVFHEVTPRPYTLLARPQAAQVVSVRDGTRTEVVPTYYPSVSDRSAAAEVVVHPGEDLAGYEIRLQSARVFRVNGKVVDADGRPAAKAVVELRPQMAAASNGGFFYTSNGRQVFSIGSTMTAPEGVPPEPVVTGRDGAFEFPAICAGDWTIRAESDPVHDELRQMDVSSVGGMSIRIGDTDPDAFRIQLAAPFDLHGTATLSDGGPIGAATSLSIRLSAENGTPEDRTSRSEGTKADGAIALRLENVIPGRYKIFADVLFGNYYAAEVLLGAGDVTGQAVELSPSSPAIKVLLKPAAAIRGSIGGGREAMVALIPKTLPGIGYSAKSTGEGNFELSGVPPGDYDAIAFDGSRISSMTERVRLLRSLAPRATSVRLEQGEVTSLQLEIVH